MALALPAASQLLDSTLEDIVDDVAEQVEEDVADALEDVVEEQVEEDVAEEIEEEVAAAVEQQVESGIAEQIEQQVAGAVEQVVESSVAQQIEQGVAGAVEQQVASGVAQQIEQEVAGAVEQVVESEIVETVQQQVESGVVQQIQQDVTGAVEQVVESEIVELVQQQVETGVVATIATQVESVVAGEVGEQLLETVEGRLDGLTDELSGAVGDLTETAEQLVGGTDELTDEILEDAEKLIEGAVELVEDPEDLVENAEQLADGGDDPASPRDTRPERFAADVDALQRAIESQVWIILVPAEHAERIVTWGFTIRERQDLATLDRVLLRVSAPEDRDIAQAALELALDAPGTEVDFNHVYRPGAEPAEELTATPVVPSGAAQRSPAPALSVGIVDTAVDTEHEALRSADIVQRDFVPYTDERPTAHGTAVASILVGDAAKLRPQLAGGRVYAASVFFADAKGDDATTAASLTVAGEWLAAEGVRVINMSLAGPPNRVLEAAIAALVERGVIVVAAVGNNGPAGEPLYPAAYANVVGVTAIDDARRVYRYANRGSHVSFAAPGVGIRVARSSGGYRTLTGTSVAAPHAAAAIAHTVAGGTDATPDAVLAELKRTAVDLGAKDFDSVFGFGLIAPPTPVTAAR